MNNVYSYHEVVYRDQDLIIEAWIKSWTKHGWNPVLLNRAACGQCQDYLARVKRHYSKSHEWYETACYARWVAMGFHGGLMVDYDVLNRGYTPEDHGNLSQSYPVFIGSNDHVPCFVAGRAAAFTEAARIFMNAPVRKGEQTSDMLLIHREFVPGVDYTPGRIVVEHGAVGWEAAKLVHFSSSTTPKPKALTMEKYL